MEVKLDDNYVCISALIDKSGSMANLNTTELAQGLTNMIKEQCDMGKEVVFYGGSFNNEFKIFADGVDGSTVKITQEHIMPDGMTALYPSFARMIKYTGNKLSEMTDRRPGKVIFVLLSDGEQTINHLGNTRNNKDKPFEGNDAKENLKELIGEHTDVWKWTFLYLGTNYDSIKAGTDLGIAPTQCLNYAYTPMGSQQAMRACSQAMGRIRSSQFNGFSNNEREMAMEDNYN